MNLGKIVGVNGNLLTVEFEKPVIQNETGFARLGDVQLKSEVIRIRGRHAELQVFESTTGLKVGDQVEFTGALLSVELGPGLLTQIFDGLQNPLPALAEQCGFFLQRGKYLQALPRDKKWKFTPSVKVGDSVQAGSAVGTVPEGIFDHRIMVPFDFEGSGTVKSVAAAGACRACDTIAVVTGANGDERDISMIMRWPVKVEVRAYADKPRPGKIMETGVRTIDTLNPMAEGGTGFIPGPFGCGKTVLQHAISKYAEADLIVLVACGERANEVVEIFTEFPELDDPRTGRKLMERTIIICNTSNMPVAAREASVWADTTSPREIRSP